jgi:uncharacterized protein (TIGR03083 family)
VGRTDSGPWPVPIREAVPDLGAYFDGVLAICELADQFSADDWNAATPCPEWRAIDLAGHLRCVADDYHEYLDDAPVSRFARLMATGAHPETLTRKLARQNAAELAALPDAAAAEHIAAFAESARAYARRLGGFWDLPHHCYRDRVVTVASMAGAACAEWHLHAWDLARALGRQYRPAAPELVLAGWRAGMPHLPAGPCAGAGPGPGVGGRTGVGGRAAEPGAWPAARAAVPGDTTNGGAPPRGDPWQILLVASGRSPDWRA